jgi:hypothetical protein
MKDEVGDATVTGPTDKAVTVPLEKVSPGLWRGTLAATEPGLHKVTMDELSAVALVGAANSREFSKVVATDEALKPIAEATGGGQFWMAGTNGRSPNNLPRLAMLQSSTKFYGQGWLGLKDREAHVVRGVQYTPLLAGVVALFLFLFAIGLTWFRESR